MSSKSNTAKLLNYKKIYVCISILVVVSLQNHCRNSKIVLNLETSTLDITVCALNTLEKRGQIYENISYYYFQFEYTMENYTIIYKYICIYL